MLHVHFRAFVFYNFPGGAQLVCRNANPTVPALMLTV